ncbi:hypothetical protein [Alkalicoccus halolimnae]|uniref:Uncharacterized protein n=1 Tax=Alkalicoccus halolimnae TaxID=1667239 RepID=A0AAJ8LV36_9BACI
MISKLKNAFMILVMKAFLNEGSQLNFLIQIIPFFKVFSVSTMPAAI